mgnify:CR=1 FL=1
MNFYKTIEANTDQMVSDISTLIKYKSIQGEAEDGMPYGKEMDDALNCVLDLAEKMGFRTKKLDGYCGYAEYGESDTYIGIFSHVDVNDEDDNEWKYDPYGGIVDQGRIYGSSAVDKGALIAVLYALKAVKESKCSLKRKVRLIIGTDNRRYFSDMDVYMKHENPPIAGFSVDGHFPVTYAEKALSMFEFEKKIVQDGEEYIEYMHGGKVDNLVPGYCSAKLVTQRKTDILKKMEVYIAESRHDINAKLLDDGVMLIDDAFYLVGRKDAQKPGDGTKNRMEPEVILSGLDKDKPIIVLEHQPKQLEELETAGADMQLCGHTHDGQMFPGNLTVKLMWENACGYLKKGNLHSIVTSGVGVWGPAMRVGTDCEICPITIHFQG